MNFVRLSLLLGLTMLVSLSAFGADMIGSSSSEKSGFEPVRPTPQDAPTASVSLPLSLTSSRRGDIKEYHGSGPRLDQRLRVNRTLVRRYSNWDLTITQVDTGRPGIVSLSYRVFHYWGNPYRSKRGYIIFRRKKQNLLRIDNLEFDAGSGRDLCRTPVKKYIKDFEIPARIFVAADEVIYVAHGDYFHPCR